MKTKLITMFLFTSMMGQSCLKDSIKENAPPKNDSIVTGHLKAGLGTLANPVGAGSDPFVVKAGGKFWSCGSNGSGIYIHNGTTVLTDAISNGTNLVYTPPSGTMYSKDLWAPELHYLSDPPSNTYIL